MNGESGNHATSEISVPVPIDQSKSEPEENNDSEQKNSMDHGWAWVIVFASFMIQFIGDGILFSFGLFFVEISQEFSSSGKSTISWIASIMVAATHAVGPIGSVLVNKYGCRAVSIFGSVLAGVGFAFGYFAKNVVTLYLTVGLIGGTGFSLMYLPAMVIVPQYFEKKRSFAVGIAVCGSGLGTFFFEWMFGFILEIFTWRQGLGIASGIIFLSISFALMYRPGPKQRETATPDIVRPETQKCDVKKLIDLTLLKNPLFLIFCVCDMLSSAGANVPYLYLPDIEQHETNSPKGTLLGIIGITNVISRLVLGYLSDKRFINRLYLYNFTLIVAGIGTIVSPHLTTIWWLRGYASLYGVCMGTYISLKSVILVDLIGLDALTDAFGLLLLIQSLGFVAGPPIAGWLYDIYGIYRQGFYFAGATFIISGVLLFTIPLMKRRKTLSVSNICNDVDNGSTNETI